MPLNLNLHANSADEVRILYAYGRIHFAAENRPATPEELFQIIANRIKADVVSVERAAAEAALSAIVPPSIT